MSAATALDGGPESSATCSSISNSVGVIPLNLVERQPESAAARATYQHQYDEYVLLYQLQLPLQSLLLYLRKGSFLLQSIEQMIHENMQES